MIDITIVYESDDEKEVARQLVNELEDRLENVFKHVSAQVWMEKDWRED